MRRIICLAVLLASTAAANAWTVGDVVYLKSGSPAMTVTSILPNSDVGLHWFAGSTVLALTLPENTLASEIPNPKIAHAEGVISKRDNPPDPALASPDALQAIPK